ncbi:efflux RND transporter periplasmic adaptor subunit [Ottowia sp.]|uniref:efflux RND transporter periplasmic adaptor subunit n=1 Tax=Ottowia sp. TaxID=1898956 RepID=UPI0025DBDDF3|nr:efflux RND transporter periplasmic adaptor subunit [Ottowia sp.]
MTADPSPVPPPPARRRWLGAALTLLLIAAMVAGAVYLVQRAKTPAAAGPSAGAPRGPGGGFGGGGGGGGVTVGATRAVQGTLPVLIDALGTVTPPMAAALVPQVSGVLTQVLFTEGQKVAKGQVLARIDARPYEQTLAQARGQRAKDEAQLSAARLTLGRYQKLWEQDSIARQDVDTQAALVKQLEGVVESDRASERAAELNVGFTTLRAPIDGVIGLRAVDPGNLVNPSGAAIATITQMAPIDVLFSVPQDRVPAVRAAQRAGQLPVQALDRARSHTLAEGVFLTLDNQINTATGTVRAKARFANADGQLFPNQFVNARLQLGTESGVLVPVTAVRTGPQGDYVYVVDEQHTAHMRPVTRGLATVDQILIAQGLAAGEHVVTEGGDRVKDGGRVQLAGDAPAGGRRAGASAPEAGASAPRDFKRNRASAPTGSAASAPVSGASTAPSATR